MALPSSTKPPLIRTCHTNSLRTVFHSLSKQSLTLGHQLRRLVASFFLRLVSSGRWLQSTVLRASQILAASVDPVWVLFVYFFFNSVAGFLMLRILQQRRGTDAALGDLDLFFTSVSAATVSSMSTVEMEALSKGQLAVLVIQMLVGGEVFTSMIQLHLAKVRLLLTQADANGEDGCGNSQIVQVKTAVSAPADAEAPADAKLEVRAIDSEWELKYRSFNVLGTVILWYNAVFLLLGSAAVLLYLHFAPGAGGARDVLRKKDIRVLGFSIFLVVSSFSSCGFLPTNENMLPFRKNSGLLLLTTPLILAGNTLFPACLRTAIWMTRGLAKGSRGAEPFDYLLRQTDGRRLSFQHLLGRSRCAHLLLTVAAFLSVQVAVFCCMDWRSAAAGGDMSSPQKVVAAFFQSVNSRHAGVSVFDLSSLSPALVALYVVMMYLPPYTTFSPVGKEQKEASESKLTHGMTKKKGRWLRERLMFSQLSWIAIFVILVCITERREFANDPLNFSVFAVVVEVVSAYGNVGLSMGYSCGRRLRRDGQEDGGCRDAWYGFAGRWSGAGKLVLIAVMFFGRLKKFNKRGGTAWKLS